MFADGLAQMQGLLGREVRVLVHFRGTFGGATLEGRLTRVQTLPPDDQAVDILLDDRQSLMLDPIDTEVLLVEDPAARRWWVEFHLPSGVMAVVEQCEPYGRSGDPDEVR
ncbi:MAG TPA: hypothetical protein VHA80_03335 [Solirubrobacterales bacterium]|nr:hypothetical protein [Solirubrobacterales bacterium]